MTARRLAALASILLAAIEIVSDWNTGIELNVSILYGIPVVLAGAARSRRLLWGVTAVLVTATLTAYATQVPEAAFPSAEPYLVDRIMSVSALLLTALLLHALMATVDALHAEQQSLQRQNRELDLAYRELSRYQNEITCQNRELERRRQEAEAPSGSTSHDLYSPINAISLMAEVIRRTAENPALASQIPGLASRLKTNALSLADLVADVVDISALDSGRTSLHETEFWLDALLREQWSRFLPLALAKNLRLELEPPDPVPCLRTDRTKLARILGNLLANAIKYTDTGAITLCGGVAPDGALFICVEDTGAGIAPEDLKRIFDEFAPSCAGTDGRQGWGLGLAICKRLAEIIGGAIDVESRPRSGSAFTVKLPADVVVDYAAGPDHASPLTAAEG
ncbi:MAG TPA: HAMP domain-containing sensor histidine kinase [Pseudomonadales bacterium]